MKEDRRKKALLHKDLFSTTNLSDPATWMEGNLCMGCTVLPSLPFMGKQRSHKEFLREASESSINTFPPPCVPTTPLLGLADLCKGRYYPINFTASSAVISLDRRAAISGGKRFLKTTTTDFHMLLLCFFGACVCVRACVCACVRACVCVCVC